MKGSKQAGKSDNTTWRNKLEDIGEKRETQKTQGQVRQTKRDIPK